MSIMQAIAAIPNNLYWLIGKGRTRPSEPLYGIQILDPESNVAIAEGEADDVAGAVTNALKKLPAGQQGSIEHLKSVVHRRGMMTREDYREAIADLARAMVQDEVKHIWCSVCEDTGHTAETCDHNPLRLARLWSEATRVWRCYHCDYTATNDAEAREHFGVSDRDLPKCQREVEPLRRFLVAALDALEAIDSEIALCGHLKELVDCALAARNAEQRDV